METRIWFGRGTAATIALLALGLVLCAAVLGATRTVKVLDPKRDSSEPSCDVLRASSKLAKRGRVVHTVTMRGTTSKLLAPSVIVKSKPFRDGVSSNFGVLGPFTETARIRITGHHHTIVMSFKRSSVAEEVGNKSRYYWAVYTCSGPGSVDRAPDTGSRRQALKQPRRHHH